MVIPGTDKKESVRGAFVRTMHEVIGMQDKDLIFKERGPGIIRVVVALETLLKRFPGDVEINYIVNKLLAAAKKLYFDASDPVSSKNYPLPHKCSSLALVWTDV